MLSQRQYVQLRTAANREGMMYQVPSPAFNDDPQHARDLQQLCQDFSDLQSLGLVIDVSNLYGDNVAEAWNEQGRHVRFMALSKFGKLMFEEGDERPVN